MSFDLRTAVAAARTRESLGGTNITVVEARRIAAAARAAGTSEAALRRQLGRTYESPLATAVPLVAAPTIRVSAGTDARVIADVVFTGGPGCVQVSLSAVGGSHRRGLLQRAFAMLVQQVYGVSRETATTLARHPQLAPFREQFVLHTGTGSLHLNLPELLSRLE